MVVALYDARIGDYLCRKDIIRFPSSHHTHKQITDLLETEM